MNKIKISFIFFIFTLPCFAITKLTNNKTPVTITSDKAVFYQKIGKGIFNGHVLLIQGTTKIDSNKMILYIDKNKKLNHAIAYGDPVVYHALPDPQKPMVTATAKKMFYSAFKHTVTLTGNAKVVQGENVITGPKIVYNTITKVVTSLPSPNQHTTIIIQPDKSSQSKEFVS